MRALLLIVVLIAGLVGVVWLGGESWVAGRATTLIGQREDVTAAQIAPLREARRVGLRLDELSYQGQVGGLPAQFDLPWVDLWLAPTAPNEVRATLPEQAQLTLNGATIDVGLAGAEAAVRLSPANSLSISRASLVAERVDLAGATAISDLRAETRLVSMGHDAPRGAGAAYDLDLQLAALDPAALSALGLQPLVLPGQVSLAGEARLWLTAAPGPGVLRGDGARPDPVGFRTEGMVLGIGDLQARLAGQVVADEQGRAAGRLALYTADSQAWLQAAADAGLVPGSAVMLGGAMLRTLSAMPLDQPVAEDGAPARAEFTFPEPAEGELRLPIFLRDGQVFLGAIPIGASPVLIPR